MNINSTAITYPNINFINFLAKAFDSFVVLSIVQDNKSQK